MLFKKVLKIRERCGFFSLALTLSSPRLKIRLGCDRVVSALFLFFVLLCTGKSPNIKQTLIWSAKNIEVSSWKKVVMDLPTDLNEYKLLFEGEYNKTSSYWSRNYVTVDNIELRSCLNKGKVIYYIQ